MNSHKNIHVYITTNFHSKLLRRTTLTRGMLSEYFLRITIAFAELDSEEDFSFPFFRQKYISPAKKKRDKCFKHCDLFGDREYAW